MCLPASNSIERFLLEEHLRTVIAENSFDRKVTASAMSDLPVKNKALALSYVQIELVFAELLRLPQPPQSELFYGVLLIELCKLQPNAMPQVVRLVSSHPLEHLCCTIATAAAITITGPILHCTILHYCAHSWRKPPKCCTIDSTGCNSSVASGSCAGSRTT